MIHLYLIVSLLIVQAYQIDVIGYDYYRPIVDNNLFRPLGWTKPDKSPRYELIATIVSKEYVKAYIREIRNGRDYFVGVGDSIGDTIVQEIRRGMVRLDGDTKFSMASFGLLNTENRKGRAKTTAEGKTSTTNSTSKLPEQESRRVRQRTRRLEGRTRGGGQWQAQIEQFQNASPEERQKMIQEFRQRMGNRRGRGD